MSLADQWPRRQISSFSQHREGDYPCIYVTDYEGFQALVAEADEVLIRWQVMVNHPDIEEDFQYDLPISRKAVKDLLDYLKPGELGVDNPFLKAAQIGELVEIDLTITRPRRGKSRKLLFLNSQVIQPVEPGSLH